MHHIFLALLGVLVRDFLRNRTNENVPLLSFLSLCLPVDMSIWRSCVYQSLKLETQESQCSSRWKVLRPRRRWCCSSSVKGGKKQNSDFRAGGSALLFCSGLSPVGMGPPTWVQEIWIAQCTDSNVILTNTPSIMFD